ncbi:MAG: restriction endonuclease [Chloroflexota bacterium]|nr:restriction endonuclease [Chloroflexota bacterium]
MPRTRTLVLLSVPWIISAIVGWFILTDQWFAGPDQVLLRYLFLAVIVVHTIALIIGWALYIWRRLQPTPESPALPEEQDLLPVLQEMSPSEFEVWVKELFEERGYWVENTPDSSDHGIDLRIVAPDGTQALVQCKRYSGTVGEPAVRDLYGAMQHEDVNQGYLVTTGRFSQAAEQWAVGKPIELIDGQQLVQLASGEGTL